MYDLGIEAFLTVVATQNITKAAIQLNLTQSTVSKRLSILETEVGSPLFERKPFRLTPEGKAFLDIAKQWTFLDKELKLLKQNGATLTLSIGVLDSVANTIFPYLYHSLRQNAPQMKIEITSMHSWEMYDAIENTTIDVALSLYTRKRPHVLVEQCYAEPVVVLRHQEPLLPEVIHPSELKSCDELHVIWNASYQLWHDNWWNNDFGFNYIPTSLILPTLLLDPQKWVIVPFLFAVKATQVYPLSYHFFYEAPPERVIYELKYKHPSPSISRALKIFDFHFHDLLNRKFLPLIANTANHFK